MRGLGYLPDPEDHRDLSVESHLGLGTDEPPSRFVEMLGHFCTVLDQGGAEACTGTSTAGAIRAWWSAHGMRVRLPSALWLWTLGRKAIGLESQNSGTYLRAVLKAAFNLGFCPEERWPSDDMARDYAKDPADDQRTFRDAFDQRGFGYYRIEGQYDERIRSIKRALSNRCPVVYGTGVSEDWLRLGRHSDPVDPPVVSRIVGGHAMYMLGYLEDRVISVNSHGLGFGNDGLWFMSWDYVVWMLTRDLWAISKPGGFG